MPDSDHALTQLGAALAELREASGLSQEEVAKHIERIEECRQHPGSGTDVGAIERGEEDPSFMTLVYIASANDVPVGEVFRAFDRVRDAGD